MVRKSGKNLSVDDDSCLNRDINDLKNERIRIDRPVYTQKIFDQQFPSTQFITFNPLRHFLLLVQAFFVCNRHNAKKQLYNRLPCIKWLKDYHLKEYLSADIIAGLTVGILYIPQGLAYGLLAQVSPINGLYTCFFPVLVYWIFGTSRHCSINVTSIAALLVGNTIAKMTPLYGNLAPTLHESKVLIAMTQAFWVGVLHLIMFMCRFSYLTAYLPEPFTKGFSAGCAVHVLTAQMKFIFGLSLKSQVGAFKIIKTYIDLFTHIGQSNVASLVISLICIPILAIIKYGINQRYSSRLLFPIPAELIIVLIGTLTSTYAHLDKLYHIDVIGPLKNGLPSPQVPPLYIIKDMILDSVILAIITYTTNFSLCDVYAKKHKYKINPTQELFAAGASNIFGSFFQCFTAGASFATSGVQDSAGGKTQVVGWVASALLAIVLVKLSHVFQYLPHACLASIILVSLKNLLFQLKELKFYWKTNKLEFLQMLLTFTSIVLLDVDYGLAIGVGYYVLINLVRQTYPNSATLGNIPNTEIYKDVKLYKDAKELNGIKIIRIEESLHYTNSGSFKKTIYKLTQCKPQEYLIKRQRILRAHARNKTIKLSLNDRLKRLFVTKHNEPKDKFQLDKENPLYLIESDRPECDVMNQFDEKSHTESQINAVIDMVTSSESNEMSSSDEDNDYPVLPKVPFTHIILDCSPLNYIDTFGVKILNQLILDYASIDVIVYLAECNDAIRNRIESMQKALLQSYVCVNSMHPTIHDCVLHAKKVNKL